MTPTEQAKTMGMVERVARAMCRARLRRMWTQLPESSIDIQADLMWRDDIEGARAACNEIRTSLFSREEIDMAGKSFDYCEGFAAGLRLIDERLKSAALSEEGE